MILVFDFAAQLHLTLGASADASVRRSVWLSCEFDRRTSVEYHPESMVEICTFMVKAEEVLGKGL